MKWIIFVVLLVLGFFIAKSLIINDSWDLMVCKTLHDDGVQCFDNSYVLKGYKTQAECVEKGMELAKNEGFECGKNCKDSEYSVLVCDIVCNKAGCKD